MFGKPIARQIHMDIPVSDEMLRHIALWTDMYEGHAPWLAKNTQSLSLPSAIASEMARMTTIEMEAKISGSARADYLSRQLEPFLRILRQHVEYACATGGIVFKPCVWNGEIRVDCIRSGQFFPLSFNSCGGVTSAVFIEEKKAGWKYYHRLEQHIIGDTYIIRNQAFVSTSANDLGSPVPLPEVEEWAGLAEETRLDNVHAPLFAYFRIPQGNIIDAGSPLGVSVYARAVRLIEEADKQYQRFLWEFEGGELAVHASIALFMPDKKGRPELPTGKERLYRVTYDEDPKESMSVFAPPFRDASLLNGLNDLLIRVEDTCGLARGTFSNPQQEARTATEIKVLRQRTYSTITDTQKSLQTTLDTLIQSMDTLATLYHLAPVGAYETAYHWDDSVITDSATERMMDKEDVRDGIMQKWEFRVKWYGEDEKTAKAAVSEQLTDDEVMDFAGAGTN